MSESLISVCGRLIRIQGRFLCVARMDADKYHFLNDPHPLIESLKGSRVRIDLFTFLEKLPAPTPAYDYPMEWDNLAAIPVTTFDEWWNSQIGFKARNKAKQAQKKGVVIREVPFDDCLARGIWKIYNECPVRQGRPFAHYGKDVATIREEESTYLDSSVFLGAFFGGELIGFLKLVADETGTQAGLMNIVSMIRHRDKAPTNALIAHAVRSCEQRRIRYLVYSNFAYGNRQRDSIMDFKERNGFKRFDIPRYYVPLTPWGAAAFQLGMHRRLVDRLPDRASGWLRALRRAWNDRKLRAATDNL